MHTRLETLETLVANQDFSEALRTHGELYAELCDRNINIAALLESGRSSGEYKKLEKIIVDLRESIEKLNAAEEEYEIGKNLENIEYIAHKEKKDSDDYEILLDALEKKARTEIEFNVIDKCEQGDVVVTTINGMLKKLNDEWLRSQQKADGFIDDWNQKIMNKIVAWCGENGIEMNEENIMIGGTRKERHYRIPQAVIDRVGVETVSEKLHELISEVTAEKQKELEKITGPIKSPLRLHIGEEIYSESADQLEAANTVLKNGKANGRMEAFKERLSPKKRQLLLSEESGDQKNIDDITVQDIPEFKRRLKKHIESESKNTLTVDGISYDIFIPLSDILHEGNPDYHIAKNAGAKSVAEFGIVVINPKITRMIRKEPDLESRITGGDVAKDVLQSIREYGDLVNTSDHITTYTSDKKDNAHARIQTLSEIKKTLKNQSLTQVQKDEMLELLTTDAKQDSFGTKKDSLERFDSAAVFNKEVAKWNTAHYVFFDVSDMGLMNGMNFDIIQQLEEKGISNESIENIIGNSGDAITNEMKDIRMKVAKKIDKEYGGMGEIRVLLGGDEVIVALEGGPGKIEKVNEDILMDLKEKTGTRISTVTHTRAEGGVNGDVESMSDEEQKEEEKNAVLLHRETMKSVDEKAGSFKEIEKARTAFMQLAGITDDAFLDQKLDSIGLDSFKNMLDGEFMKKAVNGFSVDVVTHLPVTVRELINGVNAVIKTANMKSVVMHQCADDPNTDCVSFRGSESVDSNKKRKGSVNFDDYDEYFSEVKKAAKQIKEVFAG